MSRISTFHSLQPIVFTLPQLLWNHHPQVSLEEVDIDEKGPCILQSEVGKAIKEMNRNATGDDDVPGDVLKLLGEKGLKVLKKLINTIYETGEWPKDFTEVTVIVLKKKPQAIKCSDSHNQPHCIYCKDSSKDI